jgi:hypothetical protein
VVPGALLASVLLLLLTQVFPLYVALFPPNHAYAFFGVFLVLTFWLYLLGMVLVLGAELNAFLEVPAPANVPATATAAALASPDPVAEPVAPRPQTSSFGGRLIGIVGLVVAAMLLRSQVKTGDERATA